MRNKILLLLLIPVFCLGQSKDIDSSAVYLLDHMTQIIGELESCSFNLRSSHDKKQHNYGIIKNFGIHEVYLKGPDKMLITSLEDNAHKAYWYNGEHFAYYSFKENNYSIIEAPSDILTAVDSISAMYDIDFPAADIFYPSFTDDMLEAFDTIKFVGETVVDGKSCYVIFASNTSVSLQIWLLNDAFTLPKKFVITYLDKPGNPQYEETYSDWTINPNLPDTMFDFNPPPNSKEIYIVSKSDLEN